MPSVLRRARICHGGRLVVGCYLLATGCTRLAEVQNTSWRVTFACPAQAAASESIHVSVSAGPCASPATPVYEATIRRGEESPAPAPPNLTSGTYAFSAAAYDADEAPIAAVCREVVLPTDGSVLLELPAPVGCDPKEPFSDRDADAPVRDAGVATNRDAGVATNRDAGVATNRDAGVATNEASAPTSDASEPSPVQEGGSCLGSCSSPVHSSPTPDISLPKPCWEPGEFMPVTVQIPVTAVDWLWVKDHPDYGGSDHEFWDHTGITTPGTIYQGGPNQPGGLHAPSLAGSYNITWHQNDASDKEVHSTLPFTVSRNCP